MSIGIRDSGVGFREVLISADRVILMRNPNAETRTPGDRCNG
jgi:hypothetical protein